MLKQFLTALGLLGALALPVHSKERLDNLARIEVLDGGLSARGTYLTALRLTMKDGWHTYWRAPGDAGIPPRFDWAGSRNIAEMSIIWPTPRVFEQYGLRSIGYLNQLVLPIEITPRHPGKPVRLKGDIQLGICKEVCVPTDLSISHDLDASAARNPVIAAALAQRPYSAREAGVRASTCRLSPGADGLRIEARIDMPSAGGRELAVIEPGIPDVRISEAKTRREGGTLIATGVLVNDTDSSYALDRSQVRITVLGRNHAVDINGCVPG